jgi:hypothetical protein
MHTSSFSINILFLFISLSFSTFGQTKKEKIELLSFKVDSLTQLIANERVSETNEKNYLNLEISNLEVKIVDLTNSINLLKSEIEKVNITNISQQKIIESLNKELIQLNDHIIIKTDSLKALRCQLANIEFLDYSNQKDTNALLFTNPEIDSISSNQLIELSKFFKKTTITEFTLAISNLRHAKFDNDFENAYHQFQALFSRMEKELVSKVDDPSYWIENLTVFNGIYAIKPTCIAECSYLVFNWNIKQLIKAAKHTVGDLDERFFEIKYNSECSDENETALFSIYWLNIFERTWDYGGAISVGDYQAYNLLKSTWEYKQETNLFNNFIKDLRERILIDLGHTIYLNSQQDVLTELNDIYKSNFLSDAERIKIKELIARNSVKNSKLKLQFNCATMDCEYGG